MTDFDVNALIDRYIKPYLDAANTLRNQGQAVIDELEKNPAVRSLLDTFRGLFDKPVSKITPADENALKTWYAEATAKSKPMVTTPPPDPAPPPPPPPPPPPTALPFGVVLDFDPRNHPGFKPTFGLYQSKIAPTKFVVTDGTIGGPKPNALFPIITVDGVEVGGQWEPVSG